jgi:hypothetical protein
MSNTLSGLMVLLTAMTADPTVQREPSPWLSFVGCWQQAEAPRGQPMTCILPVSGDPLAVDVVLVRDRRDGEELQRSRLSADGTVARIASSECRGTESTRFAFDGARVYLRGDLTCHAEGARRTVALFAISPDARLIQVQGRDDVSQPNVSFLVLDAVPLARVPRIVRSDLQAYDVLATEQRVAVARQPVTVDAVIETSGSVGAAVTEIWLATQAAESRVALEVDEPTRAALVAGGVPPRVIDLIVALEAPMFYQIALSEDGARVGAADAISPLEMQRVMYRLAAAASLSGMGSASLGASSFATGSRQLCNMLHGRSFGTGGTYGGYTLDGARQMMLSGCTNAALNNPKTMQAVYGTGALEPVQPSRKPAPRVQVDEPKPVSPPPAPRRP